MKKIPFPIIYSLIICFLFTACTPSAKKELQLNPLFSNHMVLQQKDNVSFWGTYNGTDNIVITTSWGEKAHAQADNMGNWKLKLKTPKAGGPYDINITTKDSTIVLTDVLIGEVWLASGQSNMEMPLEGFLPKEPVNNHLEEIAAANYPTIRFFDVARAIEPTPTTNFTGEWKITRPEDANKFSATAYFFARKLHKKLGIPIGIVSSSWGGTPVESWMSKEKLTSLNEFKKEVAQLTTNTNRDSLNSHTPSVLYNGMINPLIPYTLKGAIWYQGESNVGRAQQYLKLFPGMIEDWRERWQNDFPFYFVQIAPYTYGNEKSPALRDAQRKSLKTPKTGMAITMDIGLEKSIHPGNKQDVGDRLARLALANDYKKDIVPSGPLYKSHGIVDNKIYIEFDHIGSGLMAKNTLSGFEIAGADKQFVKATATIVNNSIEVSSKKISDPKYVRYGWKDYIVGSLYNKEGLPASSFITE